MFPEAHFFFLGHEGLSSILIILLKLALGIPGGGRRVTCVGVGRNCLGKSLPVPGGSAAAVPQNCSWSEEHMVLGCG